MTPEQLLADLRDLQLPAPAADAPEIAFVWWPLIVFVVAVATLSWLAFARRRVWRREALSILREVESDLQAGRMEAGWSRLAVLLRQLLVLAKGRSTAAAVNGEAWLQLLDELFACDVFCDGPGRNLLTLPYRPDAQPVTNPRSGASDDLAQLIQFIRQNLYRIRIE